LKEPGAFCPSSDASNRIPLVLIGRDSRDSGRDITDWLVRGIAAAGCRVWDVGVVPTPAVSYLAPKLEAVCAIVVSASHNPPEFNGIKFFSANGTKLPPRLEERIEAILHGELEAPSVSKAEIKKLYACRPELAEEYVEFLASTMPADINLCGMSLVLDCANGAAYKIAGELFERLGAKVAVIGDKPDGKNINVNCGSLHLDNLCRETRRLKADCGFALDGDADRVLFSDEKGAPLDGDDIIAIAASEMRKSGLLKWDKAVLTVMSNCGLVQWFKKENIETVQVPVGDKYVSEALEMHDLSIGGEASGHIIFRDFAPTGDGLLTAVQVLSIMRKSGRKLSWFRNLWTRYPTELRAVKVKEKTPLSKLAGFDGAVKKLEKSLGPGSRVFIRYSGTEPKLRILVEGPDAAKVRYVSDEIEKMYREKMKGALCG
jgi:phosphoglucosamine mutase